MCGTYNIMLGGEAVGNAMVIKEGLYYRFNCFCRLSGEIMYQLKVNCEKGEVNLGVCVPIPNGFGVNTRLPIKKIGEGELFFYITPRHPDITNMFIPIQAEEPFRYLEKLESAYFKTKNGIIGIVFTEEQAN